MVFAIYAKKFCIFRAKLQPRENSGHITVSYADGIHASGAAGEIVIERCNFSFTHDDPINLHGTFTRVEQRVDDNTLVLKYIHNQQGGFPQFHVGDKVQFFTRDTLESTDNETQYTVSEIISNPGEGGNDLKTMKIKFAETLPANLSDTVSGEPKYVAENVTYAPEVVIKDCTFKNIVTRGILCTTRNKVLIEDNIFYPTSMATIFLSNDSNEWYESGPIRDMTIRGNTFYVKDIGRTSWEYASAIYVHPVTKNNGLPDASNPIHKNILIENNTFYMDQDAVVKAESVENLVFKNNKVLRMNPNVSLALNPAQITMSTGSSMSLNLQKTGNNSYNRNIDNIFDFTKSKDVVIEGNTYDDGLKRYVVDTNNGNINLQVNDNELTIVNNRGESPSEAVGEVTFVNSNSDAVYVDKSGTVTALKAGTATIYAYYKWNGTFIKSNEVTLKVTGEETDGLINIPFLEAETSQQTLNDGFSITRADAANYTLSDESYIVDLQAGDLYQDNNTLKNLLLYDGVDGDFRATVKVDGMPEKEDRQWDTASFILYKDDNNYITIGKKSHYDGFCYVVEKEGSASETHGDTAYNTTTSGYLGITKVGNNITLSAKTDEGEWKIVKENINVSWLGNDLKLGFGAWETNNRSKKITFSDFKVGTAAQPYDGLTSVKFSKEVINKDWNDRFSITREDSAAYTVNTNSYIVNMQAGDLYQEHNTLKNLLLYGGVDGDFRATVKVDGMPVKEDGQWDTASFILYKDDNNYITIGKKSHYDGFCYVVEKEGIASETSGDTAYNTTTSGYLGITKVGNNITLSAKTDDGEWKIVKENIDVSWLGDNLKLGFGAWETNDRGNAVTFSDFKVEVGENATPETLVSNHAAITNIAIDQLNFNQSAFSDDYYYMNADQGKQNVTLNVTKDDASKEIRVFQGAYRKELTLAKNENTYTTDVELVDGINTLYVRVYAQDGITYKQYILGITYTPDYVKKEISDGHLKEIIFDGTDITSDFVIAGNPAKRSVTKGAVTMKVTAKEGAAVTFGWEGTELPNPETSVMEANLQLSDGEQRVQIVITFGDQEKTYYFTIEKSSYLSDMEWISAQAGYGNVNKDANSNGSTITLTDEAGNPKTFEKGIGTHADSVIKYNIEELSYDKLQGYVGIDHCKYGASYGDVQFIVLIDDVEVFDSGIMGNTASMKKVDIAIPDNAKILELRVLKGDPQYNNFDDHADWADMHFVNIGKADYTAVDVAIETVPNESELSNYTDVTAQAVKSAVANVVRGYDATRQADVDAMAKAIEDAVKALVLKLADYTAVNEAIKTVNELDRTLYTTESLEEVDKAVNAVETDKTITEQTEVDAMAKAINDAILKLTYVAANYEVVNNAIGQIPNDLDLYTEASVQALIAAKDAVESGKDITEQETVNGYAEAILEAINNLKIKADYDAVDVAIIAANALVRENYVDLTALDTAVNAVVRDFDESKQEEVNAMAEAINDAISALQLKGADYSKVDAALSKVPSDLSKYTDETVKAVNDAKAAVKEGLDITKQSEVDAMAKAIEDAVAALKEKEVEKPSSGDSNKEEDKKPSSGSSKEEDKKPVEVAPAPQQPAAPQPTAPAQKPAAPAPQPTTPAETTTPSDEAAIPAEKVDTKIVEETATEEVKEVVKETVTVTEEKAAVTTETVEKVIENTEKGATVILPLTEAAGEGQAVKEAEVPVEALEKIVKAESALTVEFEGVKVTIEPEAIKAIAEQAKGSTIELRVVPVEHHELEEEQQTALEKHDVTVRVSAQIFSDGEYIGDFKGGKARIAIPFTPAEGRKAEDHNVYYIADNGDMTLVPSVYADGYMVLETDHFSDYVIIYEGAEAENTEAKVEEDTVTEKAPVEEVVLEEKNGVPVLPIIIVVGVVIAIAAYAVTKKKHDEK